MRVVKALNKGFRNAKYSLANLYEQGRVFGQKLDHGVSIAKRAYGAIAPALQAIAPEQTKGLSQGLSKGLGAYEELRKKVQDVDAGAQSTISAVKKAVPELGL